MTDDVCGQPDELCDACLEPCVVQLQDEGVGYTEFWGHGSVDVRIVAVSGCCEAPVRGPSGFVSAEDVRRDEAAEWADREYDSRRDMEMEDEWEN